jgi:hypothetical protein
MSWEIFEEQHVTLWDWRCIDHVGMGDRSACTYIYMYHIWIIYGEYMDHIWIIYIQYISI